ncbi:hypothetical protein ACSQ67_001462 [Phaseolus vulgaris]
MERDMYYVESSYRGGFLWEKIEVGIDLPTIEVRFENLNVEAEASVGTRALPTFANFMVNIVEGMLNSLHILQSRKQHIHILQDVSGIIKPGRMTLLLGPPSSGKTTLLLALAARLDPKLKHMSTKQNDLHIAELTVRETLNFSARVQGVGSRYELSRREKEANIMPDPDIDAYMKIWMVLVGSYEIGVDIVVSASWFGVVFVGLVFTIGGNGRRSQFPMSVLRLSIG